MHKPKLPLTILPVIWEAFANRISPAYADSYLSGAELNGKRIKPRTVTAFLRLSGNRDALALLKELGLSLERPLPFHLRGIMD